MMYEWNDLPVCPNCGDSDQGWWDGLEPKWDGDEWQSTCGNCDMEYMVTMNVNTTFQTKRIDVFARRKVK